MYELNAQYKRDMDQNYLLLTLDAETDADSYPFRMLLANTIPGLLKCRVTHVDGIRKASYEITSHQSLSVFLENRKAGYDDIHRIFCSLIRMLETMSEYLINPSMLVLEPDFIWLDTGLTDIRFCLLPGYSQEIRDQFRYLTEYFLPRLDHNDNRAIMLGYSIYRRALEDVFHLESFKEILYKQPEKNEPEAPVPFQAPPAPAFPEAGSAFPGPAPVSPEKIQENLPNRFPDRSPDSEGIRGDLLKNRDLKNTGIKNREKKDKKDGTDTGTAGFIMLIPVIVSACLLLGMIAAKACGYLPDIQTEVIVFFSAVLLCGGLAGARVLSRKCRSPKAGAQDEGSRPAEVPGSSSANSFAGGTANSSASGPAGGIASPFANGFSGNAANSPVYEKKAPQIAEPIEKSAKGRLAVFDYQGSDENPESCEETIALSAAVLHGPASLVSREPGELPPVFLTEEMTILGKLQNAADVVIPVSTVSRIHARVRHKEEGYFLSDLNSRNGTSVNGRMLEANEEYLLQDQDEVDFAQARYVFLDPSQHSPA